MPWQKWSPEKISHFLIRFERRPHLKTDTRRVIERPPVSQFSSKFPVRFSPGRVL